MSEDPAVYTVPKKKVPHLKVVVDYLKGMPYSEIIKKYNITRGGIQYALEKIGVKPNRIKSESRLGYKKKNYKTGRAYLHNAGFIPVDKSHLKGDNNPVREDDLDIMERIDKKDGSNDPTCKIDIDEEGEVIYDDN